MSESLALKEGQMPGKTLAIFAGVHGNEKAGIIALQKAIEQIEVKSGKVYFTFANPWAIERDIRFVDKNLNRLFIRTNDGNTKEDERARELMKVLDECDALLDLHESNSRNSQRFIITEPSCFDLAKIFDVNIISYGWNELEPGGTDGYMTSQGKTGICIECGSVYESERNADFAYDCIKRFLSYFGAIDEKIPVSNTQKRYIEVARVGTKITDDFTFTRDFNDFDKLTEGEIFAHDGLQEYAAGENECIIFPRPNKEIGGEVFIIGKERQ